MKLLYIIYFFSFSLFAQARTIALLYTKEDLDILHSNQQYQEFLAHAKDIRPSERTEIWNNQVLDMAKLFLDDAIKYKQFTTANFDQLERIMKLGHVALNEVFLFKRKEFVVGFLEECFKKDQTNCTNLAVKILKASPLKDKITSIPSEIGLVLLNHGVKDHEVLLPFFKLAFISEQSQFLCRKEEVRNYIFNWFKEFNSSPKTTKQIKLFSADNFAPECLSSILNFFITDYIKLTSSYDREQILSWLIHLEYLEAKEIDTLLAIYLLKNPVNGDVFNLAWNKIKNLGENFSGRENIIKKLNSLDPLPDDIFGLGDPLREKTLFNLISGNLPEYIDHYSQSCIDYYSGSKNFPNGNPTIKCRDFYRLFETKFGENHPRVYKFKQAFPHYKL